MTLLRSILASVLGAVILAGCAAPEQAPGDAGDRVERVYRTGSMIPVKDAPAPPMTEEERQRLRQETADRSGSRALGVAKPTKD